MNKAMKRIDHNFAPKGCRAVADTSEDGCVGCRYDKSKAHHCGLDRKCASCERPDKRNVIFKRRKQIVNAGAKKANMYKSDADKRG